MRKRNCLPTVQPSSGSVSLMELGFRIKRAREDAGMTQRELARAIGVSHGIVGQWESHHKVPGRESIRRIAEVTLTPIAVLMFDQTSKSDRGITVTNEAEIEVLRRWRRLTKRQQDNLLELLKMSGNVRREIESDGETPER